MRDKIIEQIRSPKLIVKNIDKVKSEHFGQIRYDCFGEIVLDQDTNYQVVIKDIDPEEIGGIIEDFLAIKMTAEDDSMRYSIEVRPVIECLRYTPKILTIWYKWEEMS